MVTKNTGIMSACGNRHVTLCVWLCTTYKGEGDPFDNQLLGTSLTSCKKMFYV